MKLEMSELDVKFSVDIIIGIVMFLIGVFFDPIANELRIQHELGFGLGQVLWIGFWGLYIFWTWYYQSYYGK